MRCIRFYASQNYQKKRIVSSVATKKKWYTNQQFEQLVHTPPFVKVMRLDIFMAYVPRKTIPSPSRKLTFSVDFPADFRSLTVEIVKDTSPERTCFFPPNYDFWKSPWNLASAAVEGSLLFFGYPLWKFWEGSPTPWLKKVAILRFQTWNWRKCRFEMLKSHLKSHVESSKRNLPTFTLEVFGTWASVCEKSSNCLRFVVCN